MSAKVWITHKKCRGDVIEDQDGDSALSHAAEGMFEAVGGDEDGTDFGLGEMADDIESLEVVPELVVLADRDGEQEPVVVASVEGRIDRVYIKFLAQVEGLAGERHLVYIDFGSESAVSDKTVYRIGEPSGDEIAVGRNDFRFL